MTDGIVFALLGSMCEKELSWNYKELFSIASFSEETTLHWIWYRQKQLYREKHNKLPKLRQCAQAIYIQTIPYVPYMGHSMVCVLDAMIWSRSSAAEIKRKIRFQLLPQLGFNFIFNLLFEKERKTKNYFVGFLKYGNSSTKLPISSATKCPRSL